MELQKDSNRYRSGFTYRVRPIRGCYWQNVTDECDLSNGASYKCQILHTGISGVVICTLQPVFAISICKAPNWGISLYPKIPVLDLRDGNCKNWSRGTNNCPRYANMQNLTYVACSNAEIWFIRKTVNNTFYLVLLCRLVN